MRLVAVGGGGATCVVVGDGDAWQVDRPMIWTLCVLIIKKIVEKIQRLRKECVVISVVVAVKMIVTRWRVVGMGVAMKKQKTP